MSLSSPTWLLLVLAAIAGTVLGWVLARGRGHEADLGEQPTLPDDPAAQLSALRLEHARLQQVRNEEGNLLRASLDRVTRQRDRLAEVLEPDGLASPAVDLPTDRLAAELTQAQGALKTMAAELAETKAAAQALTLERDHLRDQLHVSLLRLADESEAARSARDQALLEQRQAHVQAWSASLARQAEHERQRAALQAELDAALAAAAALQAEVQALCDAPAPAQPPSQPPVPAPAPAMPASDAGPRGRPLVSALAVMTTTELAQQLLAAGAGHPPHGIAPDQGEPDDLKLIEGVGPVNEDWLHRQGIWYYWQVAAWTAPEMAWIIRHLPTFGSRVYRENWVAQASRLTGQVTQPA